MAKDPICGMTVDEATALNAERDGQTFCFCSERCRGVDLGAWANERYRVEVAPSPEADDTLPD